MDSPYPVLLDAIQRFVREHPHADVQRFADGVADWGQRRCELEPATLPAAALLTDAAAFADDTTGELLASFSAAADRLFWEQSYRRSDRLVGDDMLAGYGFAEVIGKRGPCISERVRAGIGVWGPQVDYPLHRHQAEEVYVVLAGEADFTVGDDMGRTRTTGDVVYVASMTTHGFRTRDRPLVVFYLWQGGDLRQTSSFGLAGVVAGREPQSRNHQHEP